MRSIPRFAWQGKKNATPPRVEPDDDEGGAGEEEGRVVVRIGGLETEDASACLELRWPKRGLLEAKELC